MRPLHFVIGASGSGKTSAVQRLQARRPDVKTFYFDSIGVPTEQAMIEKWGSGSAWQRAMTIEWVKRIRAELTDTEALLDGQTRPSFIAEACDIHGVATYQVILLHCSDQVRRARLQRRGQPELANQQMMDWAQYLITETAEIGGKVINNDGLSIAETANALEAIVDGQTS